MHQFFSFFGTLNKVPKIETLMPDRHVLVYQNVHTLSCSSAFFGVGSDFYRPNVW